MKTTIKQILILIILVLIVIGGYRFYTRPVKVDPYEAKVQAIMDRPEFIKSVRLQAETVQAKRINKLSRRSLRS